MRSRCHPTRSSNSDLGSAPLPRKRPGRMALWSAVLLLVVASAAGQTAPAWDATLHLHHPETAAQFDAKCLDGTRRLSCCKLI